MFSTLSATRDLVRPNTAGGFPTDYLIARIKGRRATLVADWHAVVFSGPPRELSDELIWGALLREFEWLHRQMNGPLQDAIAPILGLFEIKTIVLALRNLSANRRAAVEALLERSLLGDDVRTILRRAPDGAAAAAELAVLLASADEAFRDLDRLYRADSLRGFEDGLMRTYLEHVTSGTLHPVVREFLRRFVDLRNTMLLYKHLRWAVHRPCRFIRGGSVDVERLEAILARHDRGALDTVMTRLAHGSTGSSPSNEAAVETLLLRGLTASIGTLARQADPVGVVLAYVWRIYVQARNLAVLFHGTGLAPEALERELI